MLFGTIAIKNKQWNVSIATNPSEQTQGLGGLSSMPAQSGMLFDLGMPQTIQVTTVPMLFPLDIAFFSETLQITEIYRDIQPGYLVTSTLPARYFLEVNAGELEGIDVGDIAEVNVQSTQETSASLDWTGALITFMGFLVMSIFAVGLIKAFLKGSLEEPAKQPNLLPRVTLPMRNAMPPRKVGIVGTKAEKNGYAVWIRYGDVSDYFDFDGPYDAGQGVGMVLAEYPTKSFSYHYIAAGVEIEPYYTHQNYISIFWGDEDAQWVRDLSEEEKKAFERGIKSSLDFQPSTFPRKESAGSASATGKNSKGTDLNYLTDSPEYLTQTIEDIGYRDKIDNAFLKAIARARSNR